MNLIAVALPPVKSSAVKSDNVGIEQGQVERPRASARWKYHDKRGGEHLHFSIRCEHILYRRLGLESVHVDNPFDAVHPQDDVGTDKDRGKMNLDERSKAAICSTAGSL